MIQIMYAIFRIAQKREEAVAREVMKKIADDKKMNKKEKDERFGICSTLDTCYDVLHADMNW